MSDQGPESAATYIIEVEPSGRRVNVLPGTNLLDAARMAGVDIVASCGGIGICGTCKVKLVHGNMTDISPMEAETLTEDEIKAGMRLACQAEPLSNIKLDIPVSSMAHGQKMQLEGMESEHALDPVVVAFDLHIHKPTLHDLRADLTRVNGALAIAGYPSLNGTLQQYNDLSGFLRSHHWQARIVIRPGRESSQLAAVLPSQTPILGLAMDIGSTKIAMYLVDMATGGTLKAFAVMNPQIAYGEDVVSRIAYANRGEAERKQLQAILVAGINQAVEEQCQTLGYDTDQIVDVVAVGNTVIHHIFCGLPVEQLGRSPYVPVVRDALTFNAAEIGLKAAPGAQVYLPPNIAGYVGADHVAALVASQEFFNGNTAMLVDIGTNTEISLVLGERILSCSCASGPAFEGAHLHDGMRAATGAIDKIVFKDGKVVTYTIGGLAPVGICGSGILNSLAEMLNAGVLDRRGVLREKRKGDYVLVEAAKTGHGRDIVITRKDVNEIQLAKGAIRGGMLTLQVKAGLKDEEITSFIAAGAFGTHLDTRSAIRVGMFPNIPLERFHQVGNVAGMGAKQMLLSREKRSQAELMIEKVEYLELTIVPEFTQLYADSMYFPQE